MVSRLDELTKLGYKAACEIVKSVLKNGTIKLLGASQSADVATSKKKAGSDAAYLSELITAIAKNLSEPSTVFDDEFLAKT